MSMPMNAVEEKIDEALNDLVEQVSISYNLLNELGSQLENAMLPNTSTAGGEKSGVVPPEKSEIREIINKTTNSIRENNELIRSIQRRLEL